ncbi:MAG: hypothetical protein IH586_10385, partial [Anaerolineaceae bacterium]|nr:hypothetical protein [Anaerolineaceae bacterium]
QNFLLCGAFGLAAAWAQSAAGEMASVSPPYLPDPSRRVLLISGSANSAASTQIRQLAHHPEVGIWPVHAAISNAEQDGLLREISRAGKRVSVLCPSASQTLREPEWLQFSRLVSRLGAKLLPHLNPDIILMIGGETASQVCEELGVQAVDLLGEAAPGIPYGQLTGGSADGLRVITKSGGFGEVGSLVRILF